MKALHRGVNIVVEKCSKAVAILPCNFISWIYCMQEQPLFNNIFLFSFKIPTGYTVYGKKGFNAAIITGVDSRNTLSIHQALKNIEV